MQGPQDTKQSNKALVTSKVIKSVVDAWQKSMDELQAEIQKPYLEIQEELVKAMDESEYIYPWHYKRIKKVIKQISRSQNARGAISDKSKGKYSKRFVILSHQSADSTAGKIRLEVNYETGKLIQEMIHQIKQAEWKYEDLLEQGYIPKLNYKNFIFDPIKSEFYIADTKIKVRKNSTIFAICKLILENEESIFKPWELDEIVDGIGEVYSEKRDWYHIIYQKIRPLNDKIAELTKLKQFFLFDNTTIQVNPKYLSS